MDQDDLPMDQDDLLMDQDDLPMDQDDLPMVHDDDEYRYSQLESQLLEQKCQPIYI